VAAPEICHALCAARVSPLRRAAPLCARRTIYCCRLSTDAPACLCPQAGQQGCARAWLRQLARIFDFAAALPPAARVIGALSERGAHVRLRRLAPPRAGAPHPARAARRRGITIITHRRQLGLRIMFALPGLARRTRRVRRGDGAAQRRHAAPGACGAAMCVMRTNLCRELPPPRRLQPRPTLGFRRRRRRRTTRSATTGAGARSGGRGCHRQRHG
jgi:hypothetical protein